MPSYLTPLIESFTKYRKASGNWCENYEGGIARFARSCAASFPDASYLTQEMVENWCRQRDGEGNNSCRARIYPVITFVRYLRSRDLTCVQPPALPRIEPQTYIPHEFTQDELTKFFAACDALPSKPKHPWVLNRKLTVPVFFRLLYSSGIRTTEARLLRVEDVDLVHGALNIQKSKGHGQHYVALHGSMSKLMRDYDNAIAKMFSHRSYFFPSSVDKFHRTQWVQHNFYLLWDKISSVHVVPYAFRHNYATANINSWVDEGFGFDEKLLILSKSMGHSLIKSTEYYYSLVPGLADILEEKTNAGFEEIIPEVCYEEI